ncbi:MAG: hypothetical protein RLZZ214_641 [Verrucomicrobiota bacterium]|jgi:hypothetical protein
MESPSPRYILTRAVFLIAAIFVVLSGISFVKKKQRQSAIIAELKSISSDSSFFKQFYPEDARKSLIRAVALIAEANQLGIPPEKAIDRGLGIEEVFFSTDTNPYEPTAREKIIRSSLGSNYENFLKLGYKPDFHTLGTMREGKLPVIPDGPLAGKTPMIATLIDPAISPGIDKVIANLEIRPPQTENHAPTDIEIAAAKQLTRDLADAKIIEEPVRDKIIGKLAELSNK